MIRKHVSFILLMLCLCVFGCDDSANLDELLTVAPDLITPDTQGLTDDSANLDKLLAIVPDLMAPNIAGEVTDLTPEVWEKLKFEREFQMLSHLKGPAHYFWLLEGSPDYDPEKDKAWHAAEEAKIKFLEVEQLKFYNRYIDADGVSIIGNERTLDEYFVMARDIFLIMTSKNPRLREPLRDHFYIVITGGFEEYWLTDRGWPTSPQLIPNHRLTTLRNGWLYDINTCVTGGLTLDFGPRTESGLVKVRGWCVSHVMNAYNDLINPTSSFPPQHQPMSTFIHEIVHGIERIQKDIDPTFEGRLIAAHEFYLAKDPIYPTIIGEWWAGRTPRWFFRDHPEYIYPYGKSVHTAQDFIDGNPLLAELFLQWYPDISLAGIAKYYFGREKY